MDWLWSFYYDEPEEEIIEDEESIVVNQPALIALCCIFLLILSVGGIVWLFKVARELMVKVAFVWICIFAYNFIVDNFFMLVRMGASPVTIVRIVNYSLPLLDEIRNGLRQ